MKTLLTISLLFVLFGCGNTQTKYDTESKTIEIGDYLFDFPSNFKLVEEKGIDSYGGKIQGDSMLFNFDFGYYSNDLGQTPQEYLEKGYWRFDLPNLFMKEGVTYDEKNMPKVDVLNIRQATVQDSILGKGCDYVAKCKHDKTEFQFAIYIPKEIKQRNFIIDTVDNQYRKIVLAKDPQKGITGIYIRNLNGFNESLNSYLALSMATDKLTKKQQETAFEIFRTGRHKIKRK